MTEKTWTPAKAIDSSELIVFVEPTKPAMQRALNPKGAASIGLLHRFKVLDCLTGQDLVNATFLVFEPASSEHDEVIMHDSKFILFLRKMDAKEILMLRQMEQFDGGADIWTLVNTEARWANYLPVESHPKYQFPSTLKRKFTANGVGEKGAEAVGYLKKLIELRRKFREGSPIDIRNPDPFQQDVINSKIEPPATEKRRRENGP